MSGRKLNTLPFAVFIRRQKALSLYRNLLRSARYISDPNIRTSIQNEIVNNFRINSTLADSTAIKSCMTEGMRTIEQIDALANKVGDDNRHNDSKYTVGTEWPWET